MGERKKADFVPVSHQSEIEEIRTAISSGEVELTCTSADRSRLSVRGVRVSNNKLVVKPTGPAFSESQLGKVVVTFSLKSDQFFLKSNLERRHDGQFSLDLSDSIFRLQRRKDFRVEVHSSRDLRLYMDRIRSPKPIVFPVLDLSRAGLAILVKESADFPDHPLFGKGDEVQALLMRGSDEVLFRIKGEVRLVKRTRPGGRNETHARVGIMLSQYPEKQMMALVMEIYRDTFSRYGSF